VTKTGLIIGSCAYMAPERLSGQAGGPASDVYSLTCLLYECLTGRAPFEGGDLQDVMIAHVFSAPPQPSGMRRGSIPRSTASSRRAWPGSRRPVCVGGRAARAAAAAAHQRPAPGPVPPPQTRQFP